MTRKKARIVTRADLQAHYPVSTLRRHFWEESEDEPDIGWPATSEFQPSHAVYFHAYGAGRTPTRMDFVYVEPGLNADRYQEVFTPIDYEQGIDMGDERKSYSPSYLSDPKTGVWWHAKNEHPSWVRGRVKKVEPVTYMRELPPELRDPEEVWGSVYFVSAGEGGPIKIGWSQDVSRRIEELQTANAHKLVLLATLKGTMADEARCHDLFRQHRMQSEWFEHAQAILDFIEQYDGGL